MDHVKSSGLTAQSEEVANNVNLRRESIVRATESVARSAAAIDNANATIRNAEIIIKTNKDLLTAWRQNQNILNQAQNSIQLRQRAIDLNSANLRISKEAMDFGMADMQHKQKMTTSNQKLMQNQGISPDLRNALLADIQSKWALLSNASENAQKQCEFIAHDQQDNTSSVGITEMIAQGIPDSARFATLLERDITSKEMIIKDRNTNLLAQPKYINDANTDINLNNKMLNMLERL